MADIGHHFHSYIALTTFLSPLETKIARSLPLVYYKEQVITKINSTINYNDAGGLNEVMDGLALLNKDTQYLFGNGTTVGTDTTLKQVRSTFPPYMR